MKYDEKNILNPKFKYKPSYDTDITRTFRKAKLELKKQKKQAKVKGNTDV
jgi:hypothetical protein